MAFSTDNSENINIGDLVSYVNIDNKTVQAIVWEEIPSSGWFKLCDRSGKHCITLPPRVLTVSQAKVLSRL